MFNRDNWQEIFETISKNKLRTFLTAFSVAWGIFIMVVLSGAGNGLRNGAKSQFGNDAANSIYIEGGNTSMAFNGLKPNREIQLTNEDYTLIRDKITEIDNSSAMFKPRETKILSYKKEHAGFLVRPVMPDHQNLERAAIIKGRFFNMLDVQNYGKVCAIGKPVEETLFKGENPLGKYIDVAGTQYMVTGVFDDPGNGDNNRIYIPLSTAQRAWNGQNHITMMWFTTGSAGIERSEEIVKELRVLMGKKHNFNPKDEDALGVYNNNVQYERTMGMLDGIKIFVTIIGIFTLIAGIVGVSNIMMIIVKERTKEIGIRKALGATPYSIVSQIILESIFITGTAGYIGLVLGVGLIEGLRSVGVNSEFFKDPEIDFGLAIFATVLLVVSGALAGLFPSIRAARIAPVVALRED
ncbi:MAG TPA: ABC transporter permease [Bacteroidia bacterium]|jgi:putative ABC transport system permease protein|nr:ABC transporter permease [Bacteroidia bacterium]